MMSDALVFLESPHRVRAALADIGELSARRVMIGREMTKQYESFAVGSAQEVLAQLAEAPKGEFVCIVEAAESVTARFDVSHVIVPRSSRFTSRKPPISCADLRGEKKEAYELALRE